MEKRKSFVFFADWHTVLEKYDAALRCRVYDAIIRYAVGGDEPELEGEAGMAFAFIREDIDRNNRKYEEQCARRREWGKKGGAPKGNQNARKYPKEAENNLKVDLQPQGGKTTLNDNDNVNDNGNGNVNDNDNVNDSGGGINPPIINKKKGKLPPASTTKINIEEDLLDKIGSDKDYFKKVAAGFQVGPRLVEMLWERFRNEAAAKSKQHKSELDARCHFVDWARKDIEKIRKAEAKQPTRQDNGKDTKTGGASSAGGSGARPGGAASERGKTSYSCGLAED